MNRREFGELLKALREEHIEIAEDDRKWTQKKLADEANLTEVVIGTIERGSRATLEEDILLVLAKTLGLTSNERKEFFSAASGVSNQNISRYDHDPRRGLEKMFGFLEELYAPAFLMDSFGDIIALNRYCALLYDIDVDKLLKNSKSSQTNFNIITFVFAPEFEEHRAQILKGLGEAEFSQFYFNTINLFRTITFKHRSDPYFEYTLKQMRQKYRLFRRHWGDVSFNENDRFTDNIFLTMAHSKFGRVAFLGNSSTAVTTAGDLKLFVFSPRSPETVSILKQILDNLGGNEIIQLLPDWPQKPYPPKQ